MIKPVLLVPNQGWVIVARAIAEVRKQGAAIIEVSRDVEGWEKAFTKRKRFFGSVFRRYNQIFKKEKIRPFNQSL